MPYISFYLYSLYPYGLFLIFQYGIALYSLHPHTLITILHFMSHIFFTTYVHMHYFKTFPFGISKSQAYFLLFSQLTWVNPYDSELDSLAESTPESNLITINFF